MTKTPARGTRTGFTTGACSAAAARAAAIGLVAGQVPEQVDCLLPNGTLVSFTVQNGSCDGVHSHAMVVKDAGDDPDCTDKAQLTADVLLRPDLPGQVILVGGEGVGTVTMPGLGLVLGSAAINPVPRKNIEANIRVAAQSILDEAGLQVTISVPQGVEMAKKTLNARLGIVGGISILGTSGIVKPYSTAAFRASVVQAIQVAATLGLDTVVLTTGGRTEQFVMQQLPQLPAAAFIQMGDFLRYAISAVLRTGIAHVVIGGMVGKLTKIAQGATITHAGAAEVDTGLLAELALAAGANPEVCQAIRQAPTARFASEQMQQLGLGMVFHHALAERVAHTVCARHAGKFTLRVLVCDFDGNKIAEAECPQQTS